MQGGYSARRGTQATRIIIIIIIYHGIGIFPTQAEFLFLSDPCATLQAMPASHVCVALSLFVDGL